MLLAPLGEKESRWLSLHGFLSGSSLSLVRVCFCASGLSAFSCAMLRSEMNTVILLLRFLLYGGLANGRIFTFVLISFSACLFLVMFCFISCFLWCDIIPKEPLENDSDCHHFNFLPAPMPQVPLISQVSCTKYIRNLSK